jgi:uncharacterized alpha-E superfamily protein
MYQRSTLLSRQAENIFWMARYLERAENLLRLMDVTQVFSPGSVNEQNWQSILQIHEDEKAFYASYKTLTGANVIRFYLTDENNPNSVMSCVQLARHNASTLRSIISTEMWVQTNVLYNYLRGITLDDFESQDFSELFSRLRRRCQAHTGITEGTFYRDQSWYFYLLGKQLERGDQVTRLLDIKYHLLLPSLEDVGSSFDTLQWFALLRAAGGYHAFRRETPHVLSPTTVAGFLLHARRFPRSLASCFMLSKDAFYSLIRDYGLQAAEEGYEISGDLIHQLEKRPVEAIIAQGLHEFLDQMQLGIIFATNTCTKMFR